jgi:hypothetical protein
MKNNNPQLPNTVDVPPVPIDSFERVAYEREIYKANALTQYHSDMFNAGDDEFIKQTAAQTYLLNLSKITNWEDSIKSKFRLIRQDENVDEPEKRLLFKMILERSEAPIDVFSPQRQKMPTLRELESAYDYYTGIVSAYKENVNLKGWHKGVVPLGVLDEDGNAIREATPAEEIQYKYAKQQLLKHPITKAFTPEVTQPEPSVSGVPVLPASETNKVLDLETAKTILQQVGGDKEKAREMAKSLGYVEPHKMESVGDIIEKETSGFFTGARGVSKLNTPPYYPEITPTAEETKKYMELGGSKTKEGRNYWDKLKEKYLKEIK